MSALKILEKWQDQREILESTSQSIIDKISKGYKVKLTNEVISEMVQNGWTKENICPAVVWNGKE